MDTRICGIDADVDAKTLFSILAQDIRFFEGGSISSTSSTLVSGSVRVSLNSNFYLSTICFLYL